MPIDRGDLERIWKVPMRAIFRAFLGDRRGATAIEYGLIVTVLSLAIIAGVSNAHNSIENMFIDLANKFAATGP